MGKTTPVNDAGEVVLPSESSYHACCLISCRAITAAIANEHLTPTEDCCKVSTAEKVPELLSRLIRHWEGMRCVAPATPRLTSPCKAMAVM